MKIIRCAVIRLQAWALETPFPGSAWLVNACDWLLSKL